MDKIQKALAQLDSKRRVKVLLILELIKHNQLENLDIKRLNVASTMFRVRIGKMRIIYAVEDSGIDIIALALRNEKTYKKL
jgi:mRNA-degrading endonuclease RelE of RelBE toxin-antitoxin system